MNTNGQRLRFAAAAILAVLFGCHCKSTDSENVITSLEGASKFGKFGKLTPVGQKRSGGYKFAGVNDQEEKSEGAQRVKNTNRNEKVIKNRDGEVVRTEKKKDLYSDRSAATASESGSRFGEKKKAKFAKDKFAAKEFKTPEYIKRQGFSGAREFENGDQKARESGTESKKFANRLFKTKAASENNQLAEESGSNHRDTGKVFETGSNRTGARAQENAAAPEGVPLSSGYRDNVKMSLDEVKKMLNPASARSDA